MEKTLLKDMGQWIYRNARPLDLARWQFHFEGASEAGVIRALTAYQNQDGGFGHGLEPDAWNTNSSPIQTWYATEMLREVAFSNKDHPLIQGILDYLASGQDYANDRWLNTVATNNDFPHAPWWTFSSDKEASKGFNPTISLAAFVLRFGQDPSPLYSRALALVKAGLKEGFDKGIKDMHVLYNYIRTLEDLKQAACLDGMIPRLEAALKEAVYNILERDTCLWKDQYVPMPSGYIFSPESIFYKDNEALVAHELDTVLDLRNSEGVWDIPWAWACDPEAYGVSARWWQGHLVVQKLLFLKAFGRLKN